MSAIVWNERFSVGVKSLDDQHECIIDVINTLKAQEASNASSLIFDLLSQLIVYSNQHFEAEEALLSQYKYPELQTQKNDHLDYSLKITEFYQAAINNKSTLPCEMLEYVSAWWVNHILVDDMKYKDFLKAKGV